MADAIRARPDSQKNLVGFVVGDVNYAVEVAKVREIVNPLELTPLPHTPVEVAGVCDHRGEVVPVLDLRKRFGLPSRAADRGTKWILLIARDHLVGLVVDGVTDVFGATSEEIRPTPEVGGDRSTRGILGVVPHAGKLTFVLDVARFVAVVDALAAQGAL